MKMIISTENENLQKVWKISHLSKLYFTTITIELNKTQSNYKYRCVAHSLLLKFITNAINLRYGERKRMKILVAYDGSSSSDNALDDLQKAGLPEEDVEVLIVSVAEVWMPKIPNPDLNGVGFQEEDYPNFINELSNKRLKVAKSTVYEAETLSRHARERIHAKFPKWKATNESTDGSPGLEILMYADKFNPDLIVLGSQGRNSIGRVLMGSISQKVLTEAKCSVRIARGKIEVDPLPLRIMIGFDGSLGSQISVEEVASRNWGGNAEVCLLAAVHPLVPTTIGRFITPVTDWIDKDFKSEINWMRKLAESSIRKLEKAELNAEINIIEGNPKEVIVKEAVKWQADSIFLGAHSYSSALERFLIGSTSAAVAERVSCSVESVRE